MGYLPSFVRYHNGLNVKEKLLYCELTAMANANGIVALDNEHLGMVLEVGSPRVRSMLNKLVNLRLIDEMGKSHISFGTDIKTIVAAFESEQTAEIGKTDKVTEITDIIVDIWNTHFETKFRSTNALKAIVRARLKSFKPDEIILAVKNRIHDVEHNDWYDDPDNSHYRKILDLAIRDDKRTEKYVNYIQKDRKIDFGKQTVAAKVVTNKNILE